MDNPSVQAVPPRLAFDTAALERYLFRSLGPIGTVSVAKFSGGQSNPTYRIDTNKGPMVLRRKPPGSTLSSAHAIDREARVMRALGAAGYPVPKIQLECDDASVIGTPFYVMEYLDGRIFWNPLLPDQSVSERRAIYLTLTDALAQLHSFQIESVGLADFGSTGNYFQRQVKRWTKQYHNVPDDPVPEMDRLSTWLAQNTPDDCQAAVVHGDFRLDNIVFHTSSPKIVGVIDWELATIGSPLVDLSYFLLSWMLPFNASGGPALANTDLKSLGIPTAEEIKQRYFARSNLRRPENFDFYTIYNLFRAAAILHGVAARNRAGNAANDQALHMGARVRQVARVGCAMLEKLDG